MQGWWAASYAVLWALVAILCIVVVALARQIGTLHLRLGPRGALEVDTEGPGLGEAPEPVDTADIDGAPVSVGGPGEGQVLMFVSPGCRICEQVLPGLAPAARAADLTPYVVSDDDDPDALSFFASKRSHARVVAEPDVARRYQIPGTPYVVVLDDRGIVRAKGTVNNLEQMEGLVDSALRRTRDAEHERQAS